MDLGALTVSRVVVHYVPTGRDAGADLVLTSQPLALDDELVGYFAARVTERLARRGLDVIADPDPGVDSTASEALAAALADPDLLVDSSQILGRRLHGVQTAANSPGLLAVLEGTVGGRRCIVVLKLERQRGVSFDIDAATGAVDLELLRNLTLTDKTKVYKTALFGLDGSGELRGYVADDQRTAASGSLVAGFFLGRFLGCKPREPAAQQTSRFANAATVAIDEEFASPHKRGRYQVALLATLHDNSTELHPAGFAVAHLDGADRAPFLRRLEAEGVDPRQTFAKDLSRTKLNQFRVDYASGMTLVGPPEALEAHVKLPPEGASDQATHLNDTVAKVVAGR